MSVQIQTPTTPTALILKLAASPALLPLLDAHKETLEALVENIEETPAYQHLWDSLPADVRPELSRYMYQLIGIINDAFLAGLLSAHVQAVD